MHTLNDAVWWFNGTHSKANVLLIAPHTEGTDIKVDAALNLISFELIYE